MSPDRGTRRLAARNCNRNHTHLFRIVKCRGALCSCILFIVSLPLAGCVPFDPPGLPVEGTVVDEESGEPLSGVAVFVRTLSRGVTETGRGSAIVLDGGFQVKTFPLKGSFPTDQIEVTITRGSCDTRCLFDKDNGFTVENLGLFAGEITFRITDPIRVPRCTEDGDAPP